jgi:hypothetical protein
MNEIFLVTFKPISKLDGYYFKCGICICLQCDKKFEYYSDYLSHTCNEIFLVLIKPTFKWCKCKSCRAQIWSSKELSLCSMCYAYQRYGWHADRVHRTEAEPR